jgi:hypothetical protein
MMRRMLSPDQMVEIDALALYKKYTDRFAIDEVPETERNAVAAQVAELVLTKLANVSSAAASSGCPGSDPA